MNRKLDFIVYFFIPIIFVVLGCKNGGKSSEVVSETDTISIQISDSLPWSERMALSEIHRFPDPTLLDFQEKSRWSYTNGLVLQAMSRVYGRTGNEKIYDYIYDYANRMINEDGSIQTYRSADYNLDMIKSGDVIFWLQRRILNLDLKWRWTACTSN